MKEERPKSGSVERTPRVCRELAHTADILAEFADALSAFGLVGETRAAKTLYLALTSRLLDEPVSVAVKGPSSAGKSYLAKQVLKFFPDSAYHPLTGMSEKALIYSDEPLINRFIVIYEAAGFQDGNVFIRSLLTEGHVRYQTVDKGKGGKLTGRLIERDGPTGLLLTTTDTRMHHEIETRLFSVSVEDTQEQTRRILQSLARDGERSPGRIDLEPWMALQTWLETGERHVAIPYARQLAQLIPPVAVRLRRDFKAVLNLIRAHALLHRATREQGNGGRIVATIDDYAAVRELVAAEVAYGAETSVPHIVRETVDAVRKLTVKKKGLGSSRVVSLTTLSGALDIDKSSASRRVAAAIERGYLTNQEDRPGRAAKLALGEALPDDIEILPTAATLAKRCSVVPNGKRVAAKGKLRPSSE